MAHLPKNEERVWRNNVLKRGYDSVLDIANDGWWASELISEALNFSCQSKWTCQSTECCQSNHTRGRGCIRWVAYFLSMLHVLYTVKCYLIEETV